MDTSDKIGSSDFVGAGCVRMFTTVRIPCGKEDVRFDGFQDILCGTISLVSIGIGYLVFLIYILLVYVFIYLRELKWLVKSLTATFVVERVGAWKCVRVGNSQGESHPNALPVL